MSKRLRLAIQKKGRLGGSLPSFLQKCGLDFEFHDRQLLISCSNFPIDLLAIRHRDILPFVESGQADLGIVGSDVYREERSSLEQIASLGLAKSSLVLAVPKHSSYLAAHDLNGKTIATTFPVITKEYFQGIGIDVRIVTLSGSVEIAPQLDMADAIVDLVGTGTTLRINGLRPLETLHEAESIVVVRSGLDHDEQKTVDALSLRFQSVRQAKLHKYVLFNLPEDKLEQVHTVFPGISGPSIMRVESKNPTLAIHVVVPAEQLWEHIEQLRELGATGVVVLPIENLLF